MAVLVLLPVAMLKYPDGSNLKGQRIILAHSSMCSPSGQALENESCASTVERHLGCTSARTHHFTQEPLLRGVGLLTIRTALT